jgi:uncharacterized membrane protein
MPGMIEDSLPASAENGGGLRPRRFAAAAIGDALGTGWDTFRAIPRASVGFAALFVACGALILGMAGQLGLSPMALPLAGGFMLVGPALLTGFFRLADLHAAGIEPRFVDALTAFARAPAGLWVVALLCTFLFLIWITDAAVLYAFTIGGQHLPYELPWLLDWQRDVVAFELWAALLGAALAFMILAISAFSVPLLHDRRATLAPAVSASARAVVGNLPPSLAWGLILAGSILLSILLLPLLMVTLPVLAYASQALSRTVFPPARNAPTVG